MSAEPSRGEPAQGSRLVRNRDLKSEIIPSLIGRREKRPWACVLTGDFVEFLQIDL